MNTASKTRHVFILFLADIVWGIAFVAQSKGGDAVGAFSFNGIRFLIGALCLLPVIKILDKKELTVNRPEAAWNQHGRRIRQGWLSYSCIYTYGAYTRDFPQKKMWSQNMDRCVYCAYRHVFSVHEWGIFT